MHCLRCGAELEKDQIACSKCGFLEDITPGTKEKKKTPLELMINADRYYAGFWRRAGALMLDLLILSAFVAILAGVIGGIIYGMSWLGHHGVDFRIIGSFAIGFGAVFAVALSGVYFIGFESSKYRATFGKRIMSLYVTTKEGGTVSRGRAVIRYWGKMLSVLILFGGFWMVGWQKKKRTLHDYLAGTFVLYQIRPKSQRKLEPEPATDQSEAERSSGFWMRRFLQRK
ncbi:MAG TPA: hypothetical protein DDW65_01495 [Firmicutes bacterium]|nr:hypothetical protein [Bacillota bacterium]